MATEISKKQSLREDTKRRDSTSDYPMIDLREVCDFVQKIWEKGIQTESMSVVAKACGYSAPTSTGYYRRMAASRLFKMIETQRARLTQLALDFVKPDSDDAKTRALREAMHSVPAYQPLLEKYSGTKLNAGTLANGITRISNLSDDCALICAKVFIESSRFAGELDADHTLLAFQKNGGVDSPIAAATNEFSQVPSSSIPISADGDLETHSLTLDASKKRRIILQAPSSVSPAELKRIQDWLSFQLLVQEQSPNSGN
jgi:hypothetical protein